MTGWASTGFDGLDKVLCDLKKGDNVVWQVDRLDDYRHFAEPFARQAIRDGRRRTVTSVRKPSCEHLSIIVGAHANRRRSA